MTKPISKELRAFLQSWEDWRLAGAPEGEPFFRHQGLCSSVWNSIVPTDFDVLIDLRYEIKILFIKEGLDKTYPFGEESYNTCTFSKRQHLCPKRISWVKKHLENK